LMNNRLALIASKNLRIGAEVISMFRCDTWTATIVDIESDGFINILMDTGETKTVKPTTIQTK
jgi:hypothetical protein